MSAYVQMNFSVGMRNVLFDDTWSKLQDKSFDDLLTALPRKESDNTTSGEDGAPHTLDSLFKDANKSFQRCEKDIKAITYLVMEVQAKESQNALARSSTSPTSCCKCSRCAITDSPFYQKYPEAVDAQIRLDDKALIPTFQAVLES